MKNFNILKRSKLFGGSFNNNRIFSFTSYDNSKNWYKILNLDKNATPEDIKKSYYTLAKKYHPDVNKGSDSQFKEINHAYEILSNEESRRKYDQNLAGDSYTASTQNTYSNYHYGYQSKGGGYTRPNPYYDYNEWQKRNGNMNSEFFHRTSYTYKKKRDRNVNDQWNTNNFYNNFHENMSGNYEEYDKKEYDKFVKKLMYYPMIFMLLYSILFFLPSRNQSKEFVLYDENSGQVYVLDEQSYNEMKKKSLKQPQQRNIANPPPPSYNHLRRDLGQ